MSESEDLVTQLAEMVERLRDLPDEKDSKADRAKAFETLSATKRDLANRLTNAASSHSQHARLLRRDLDEKLDNADKVVALWEEKLNEKEPLTVDVGRRMQWNSFSTSPVVAKITGSAPALSHPLAKEVALRRTAPRLLLEHKWNRAANSRNPTTIGVHTGPQIVPGTSTPP